MQTLVSVVDVIVLLLYIAYIPRVILKGSGSLLLAVCLTVVVAVFAVISFVGNAGLLEKTSSLTHVIVLLFLLVMAALARASAAANPA